MNKTYFCRFLAAFVITVTVICTFSCVTAQASCIIDPAGTYIEAENSTGISYLRTGSTCYDFTEQSMSGANGGRVLKAGNCGGYGSYPYRGQIRDYRVYFPVTGTYYMWMRGKRVSSGNDLFFAVDTTNSSGWKAWALTSYSFHWTSDLRIGSANTIEITTAGYHTIKIAKRDAYVVIDGFFLTTNPLYTPTDATVPGQVTTADPTAGCTGAMWVTDSTNLSTSSHDFFDSATLDFNLTNAGLSNDTGTGTVTSSVSWMSVSDTVSALQVGQSQTLTIDFDTSSLDVGTHTGILTITSSGSQVVNSPLNLIVTLTIKGSTNCGDVPLYAEDIISPAIMVLLDHSGSMGWDTPSRISIARTALADLFTDRTIEWGFATWTSSTTYGHKQSDNWTRFRVGCHAHDEAHQVALQSRLLHNSPTGGTPLANAMEAGLDYFECSRKDEFYDEAYFKSDCQPRILIHFTDGQGSTISQVENAMNGLIDKEISIVAVGYSSGASNVAQLNTIAKMMQDAAKINTTDDLYDLHNDIDGDSVSDPFEASNPTELADAFATIVSSVKAQMFHGASPAMSSSSSDEAILLEAAFDGTDWSGDLMATTFNIFTGELNTDYKWQASKKMPATINPFIHNAALGTVTPYTTDSIVGDHFLCKPLGDIINSGPAIVRSIPPYYYKFDGYFDFKYDEQITSRDAVAYVGANDGALHAFNLEDGVEKWRFYPNAVISKLALATSDPKFDMCSADYCHKYLMDGSPKLADIYVDASTGWRTILTTGLGLGGAAYFCLDITHGQAFNTGAKQSKFLWEFTDPELGLAMSEPVTARLTAGGSDAVWVTFFGSGQLEDKDDQKDKEAYLFALKSYDGSNIWYDANGPSFKLKLSSTTLKNDATSTPLVVDSSGDDYIYDKLYIGNLYGNLYRVIGLGAHYAPASGAFFFSGNTGHETPITATPSFAYNASDDIWVYFGTGRYEQQIDKSSSHQQYFYGLRDEINAISFDAQGLPYTLDELVVMEAKIIEAYALTSQGEKADLDGDGTKDKYTYRVITCSSPDANGNCNPENKPWALKLATTPEEPSERIITQPLINSGIVFVASFIPDFDECSGGGEAYIFAVDWETGEPAEEAVFDTNGDGTINDADKTVEDESGTRHKLAGFSLGKGKPSKSMGLYGNNIAVGGTSGLLSGESPMKSGGMINVNLPDQQTTLKSWQQDFK